jgi:hypothetical protein
MGGRFSLRDQLDLYCKPVSGDFRNNSREEFLGYVEQHHCLVFAAEDLDFALNTILGTVLIKAAVYKNLVRARRWMNFLQE